MAAGGFKEFVAGEILDEDDINDFLMQGVLVFAGTAARGSAIGTAVEGQFAFLKDTDTLTYYSGSAWEELSTTPGAAVVSGTTGSPTLGTVSSGGTTYNVYSFTGDGSITISKGGFAEVLLVGGGGAGGSGQGGGGGAGGHLALASTFLPVGTATVVVGAGGTGYSNASYTTVGFSGRGGRTSRLGNYYAPGGGGGAGFSDKNNASNDYAGNIGAAGGSGGGGGGTNGAAVSSTGGLGVLGLGNDGGPVGFLAGGGGGGAGAVGATPGSQIGGNGGAGTANSITGSSVTRAGGGGGWGNVTFGTAVSGGGGNAAVNGAAGTANSGGGGGGSSTGNAGGNGGSGIVIVRVAV